jgi:hypothetical protein
MPPPGEHLIQSRTVRRCDRGEEPVVKLLNVDPVWVLACHLLIPLHGQHDAAFAGGVRHVQSACGYIGMKALIRWERVQSHPEGCSTI